MDDERYETIRQSLVANGFVNDVSPEGNIIRQRWIHAGRGVEVDFLMPLDPPDGPGAGRLQNLTKDFAAIKMLGLDLAIEHKQIIELSGRDLDNVELTRPIPVCRPEVLIVLKAIAIVELRKPKDAYDLCFCIAQDRGRPSRSSDVAQRAATTPGARAHGPESTREL